MGALIKASSVRAGHAAMRKQFGDATFDKAISLLSEEDRALVSALDRSTLYPLIVDGRLQQHLVDLSSPGDRAAADRAFRAAAGMQADDMLNGVFSVFARFVSPGQAFSRAGTIIASAYEGVTSHTTPAAEGVGGVIAIRGLGDLTYASPWLSGWMEHALKRFGAKSARVTERAWLAGVTGSDDLQFDVTWE